MRLPLNKVSLFWESTLLIYYYLHYYYSLIYKKALHKTYRFQNRWVGRRYDGTRRIETGFQKTFVNFVLLVFSKNKKLNNEI